MKIRPIVEGYGDVSAIPELLRRLQFEYGLGAHGVQIARPVKCTRTQFNSEDQIRRVVRLAITDRDCIGLLLVLDSDDDCPKLHAPKITAWSNREARTTPCEVVMANREYEAWLLGSIESLRGHRGIRLDAAPEDNPEEFRGAKERLETKMRPGFSYSETADQVALTCLADLHSVYERCRSFRRLVNGFQNLLRAAGVGVNEWRCRNT